MHDNMCVYIHLHIYICIHLCKYVCTNGLIKVLKIKPPAKIVYGIDWNKRGLFEIGIVFEAVDIRYR